MNRAGATVLCLAAGIVPMAGAQDLELGAVEQRVLLGPDEDGDLLVSIKVVVTNNGDEGREVSLTIKAFDDDGFELFDLSLEGKVGAKESRAITSTEYVSAEMYGQADSWTVEE